MPNQVRRLKTAGSKARLRRQLLLALPTHGGARPRAGRKPGRGRRRASHKKRPAVNARFPVHVTVRMRRDVPGLRNFERAHVLQRAFVKGCTKPGFRICQFSIQGNHVHLVCEASSADRLARGIQGWSVRVARGINRKVGRRGQLFFDRYHATAITTPSQMRNTLCYVLQNARRHGAELDRRWHGVDPFSSAWWFDGWDSERWRLGLVSADEPPVAPAKTWLLTTGWRRRGLIGVTEVPPAARP